MYFATKNWLSPKARRVIRDSYQQQISITNRLSTPKNGIRKKTFEGVVTDDAREGSQEPVNLLGSVSLRPNVMMRIANNRNLAGRNLNVQ